MLLIIIVIGVLLYYGFKGNINTPTINKNSPEEMLKERFVLGEIDEVTYLQMMETLKK